MKKCRIAVLFLLFALSVSLLGGMSANAEAGGETGRIPQIDSSTARIPITDAIYELFTGTYGMTGPEPVCSKTHGAWLNLADGAADILFLVAPTADEFAYFAEKGVDIEMKIFGYDGLVFLGSGANPVSNLTSAQIRSIYSGKIKNWNKIPGGPNADVVVYIRNAESGSQRLFESLVWEGYDMPDFQSMRFQEGEVDPAVTQRKTTREVIVSEEMGEVVRKVVATYVDQYAIGFNIMSYVDSEFLNPSTDNKSVRTTGEVNLRTGPGLDYATVGAIPKGSTLSYLGESSVDSRGVEWYKVQHATQGAVWVSSRYSQFDSAAANLKLFSVDGYAPTTENFAAGKYPFVTTSYVAIRADEPADSPARKLYDWIGTDESRELLTANSTLSVSFSDSVVLRTSGRDPAANAALAGIIETLDQEALTRQALYEFTQEELGYLRQGVYARSGKVFPQEKYDAYFRSMGWYAPQEGSDKEVSARFNEHQRANLALIIEYERELRRANANRSGQVGGERTLAYAKGTSYLSGDDVLEAQRSLAAQGYLEEADCDGSFGPKSAEAVAAYQRDNGLTPSGEIDADTRMLLLN